MKILVVDDDPGTLNSIRICLMSHGHKVVTARDGHEALEIVQSSLQEAKPLEIMVTDLKMPCLNGLDLIQTTRKLKPQLKIILITAYGDENIRRKIMGVKQTGYLEKPFAPEILIKMIEDLSNHDPRLLVRQTGH